MDKGEKTTEIQINYKAADIQSNNLKKKRKNFESKSNACGYSSQR
jgi:hypothetical protein